MSPILRARTAASVRDAAPIFLRMLQTCLLTVNRLTPRASPISLSARPSAIPCSTEVSRLERPGFRRFGIESIEAWQGPTAGPVLPVGTDSLIQIAVVMAHPLQGGGV